MTYMEWQINDMKAPLLENVRKAMEYHAKKYGRLPNIIEYSHKIEHFPYIDKVTVRRISIPANILLLSVD